MSENISVYKHRGNVIQNCITEEEIMTEDFIFDIVSGCTLIYNELGSVCVKLQDNTVHLIVENTAYISNNSLSVLVSHAKFSDGGRKICVISRISSKLSVHHIHIYDIASLSVEYTRVFHEYERKCNCSGKLFFIRNKIFIPYDHDQNITIDLNDTYIVHFYNPKTQIIYNENITYRDSIIDDQKNMLWHEVAHSDNLKVYKTFDRTEKKHVYKIIMNLGDILILKRDLCNEINEYLFIREIVSISKFKFDD
jgi:hypothetical protein